MKASLRIGRIFGIPIIVNASWLITFSAVTAILALQVYPDWLADDSRYGDNQVWLWLMALGSGLAFFVSILLHELAHSVVALRQGIPVRSITLFILGGVSQIGGEARRPSHEIVMAVAGPGMSVLLGILFFAAWTIVGDNPPLGPVLGWLFVMNIILAVFNMAPGFPMDGGRVLRSLLWSVTGSLLRATRLATLVSRGIGYGLAAFGALTFVGVFGFFDSEFSGLWFIVVGLFIEGSARQSWEQARAMNALSRHKAEDLMTTALMTVEQHERLSNVLGRASPRFIFFVVDSLKNVVGVLTEQEAAGYKGNKAADPTAGQLMSRTGETRVAALDEDGASLFQAMESGALWHMPVVSDGQVLGVVSRERLLGLLSAQLGVQPGLSSSR